MMETASPAKSLKGVAKIGWRAYRKYFSEVGYVTRAINYSYTSLNQWNNIQARKKVAAALSLSPQQQNLVDELKANGGAKTSLQAFGFNDDLITSLRQQAGQFGEKTPEEIRALRGGASKTYWFDLFDKHTPASAPILNFACDKKILSVVAGYLGQVPTLQYISFYYSPPNSGQDKLIGSQSWHFDNEHKRRLKIFLSPYDITPENGPTTFLPLPYSKPELYKNYPDYFDDAQAESFGIDIKQKVQMTTKPGEFYMADTSRTFHYGCRNQTKSRWLVIISYGPVESHLRPKGWKELYNPTALTAENAAILGQFGIL